MKYPFDRPTLPSLWHLEVETNLIQIEMVTLEKNGFLLSQKPRYPHIN
jgi:hypothetical protein